MIITLDLDGTLMPAQEDYDAARYAFADWLRDRSDGHIPVGEAVETQARYSAELWEEYGAAMERFPLACREAYEELARRYDRSLEEDASAIAYEHGRMAYLSEEGYAQKGFFPGVEAMFDVLEDRAETVHIITAGDGRVQERKIRGLDLEGRVDDWHVTDHKEAVIADLAEDETVWHVGNSETSDLFPALEAGVGAVHVPGEGWNPDFAREDPPEDAPWLRLRDRNRFQEAMDAIEAYEAGDVEALRSFRAEA